MLRIDDDISRLPASPAARDAITELHFHLVLSRLQACARCGRRLGVRAIVTDHDIASRILDAMQAAARAPPSADSTVAYDAPFA